MMRIRNEPEAGRRYPLYEIRALIQSVDVIDDVKIDGFKHHIHAALFCLFLHLLHILHQTIHYFFRAGKIRDYAAHGTQQNHAAKFRRQINVLTQPVNRLLLAGRILINQTQAISKILRAGGNGRDLQMVLLH